MCIGGRYCHRVFGKHPIFCWRMRMDVFKFMHTRPSSEQVPMLFQQLAQFVVVFFADHDAVVFGHNDEGADFGIAKNQGGQGFVLRIQRS